MPRHCVLKYSAFRIPHSALRRNDRCPGLPGSKGQAGIALFLVLWVLTLLSVIVGEFCHAMRGEVNTVRNFKEETEAFYIAQAGVWRAIEELVRKHVFPKPPEEKSLMAEEESPVDVWRVNVDIPAVMFGQGTFEVRLDNESGKVDLNAANPAMLRMLLNNSELEEQEKDVIVDSILDWRDEDDLHRLNGAEDDYYLGLPKPYPCKDGDFDSVEELLLVRGVTSELFLGGFKDLVTVFPYEVAAGAGFGPGRKKRQKGLDKVNINAAAARLLARFPSVTEEAIQQLVEYRAVKDIQSPAELLEILGPEAYAGIAPYVDFSSSPYYRIRSLGRVADSSTRRGVEAVVMIDGRLSRGYRILQWGDRLDYALFKPAALSGPAGDSEK